MFILLPGESQCLGNLGFGNHHDTMPFFCMERAILGHFPLWGGNFFFFFSQRVCDNFPDLFEGCAASSSLAMATGLAFGEGLEENLCRLFPGAARYISPFCSLPK